MDPAEEQAQEIEVLESIYPDEFEKISDKEILIRVALDTPSDRAHCLLLSIVYPDTYPEVVPDISVTVAENEDSEEYDSDGSGESDEDDEATREAKVALHMSEQVEFDATCLQDLEQILSSEAESQIGIPMVFALATQLKEEAELMFDKILKDMNDAYEQRSREREQKEQQKFSGTKVTRELYLEWREKFRAEMKIEELQEAKRLAMHNGKLTGRQIFERGLAGADDDEDIVEGLKKIDV